MSNDDPYEVGHKKPPQQHQFKKGQSGNPVGRPKSPKDALTAIRNALNERVEATEGGERKTFSKLEAMAKQIVNKAASGDARATKQLLALKQLYDDGTVDGAPTPMTEADKEVADAIVERIRKSFTNQPIAAKGDSDEPPKS